MSRKPTRKHLKIDQSLLKNSNKIAPFKWRVGDWDISLNPTKGYSVFNYKTGSSNLREFYEQTHFH
jgi:hypothetical protein